MKGKRGEIRVRKVRLIDDRSAERRGWKRKREVHSREVTRRLFIRARCTDVLVFHKRLFFVYLPYSYTIKASGYAVVIHRPARLCIQPQRSSSPVEYRV